LTWTDNSLNETSFSIERSTNGGAFSEIGTADYGNTRYTDTTIDSRLNYSYKVRALSDLGYSGYTNTVSIDGAVVPDVPVGLTATAGAGKVILEWTANIDNTVEYLIYRSTDDSNYTLVQNVTGISTTRWIDSSIVAGITYYYQISAKDNASPQPNESDRSSSVYATPTAIQNTTRGAIKFSNITLINGL
jgi:titin